MVTLDGLIVAADSRIPGFRNLADENVRKGTTASGTVKYRYQSVSFFLETLGGHVSRNNTVVWKTRDQRWRTLNVSTPTELFVNLARRNNDPSSVTQFAFSWSTQLKPTVGAPRGKPQNHIPTSLLYRTRSSALRGGRV